MFKSMKCRLKGHLFVDSRSQPGTQVCVRCGNRRPFEGLASTADEIGTNQADRSITPNG